MNYVELYAEGEFVVKQLAKEAIEELRPFAIVPTAKQDYEFTARGKRVPACASGMKSRLRGPGHTEVPPKPFPVEILAKNVSPLQVAYKLIAERQSFWYDGPRGEYSGFRVTEDGYRAVKAMKEILRVAKRGEK